MTPQQIEQMRINSRRKGLTMYDDELAAEWKEYKAENVDYDKNIIE